MAKRHIGKVRIVVHEAHPEDPASRSRPVIDIISVDVPANTAERNKAKAQVMKVLSTQLDQLFDGHIVQFEVEAEA